MRVKLIVILVSLVFLIIFAVQNYEIVTVQFLFWSFQTSRTIVLLTTLIIGIIIGWIISFKKKR